MAEALITAQDCSPIRTEQDGCDVEWLSELAATPVDDLVIRLGGRERDSEPLVWTDSWGKWHAGRYVGYIEFRNRRLSIEPRFDVDIGEWLAEALNLSVVPDVPGNLEEGPFLVRLLGVVWGAGLVRAAKHGLPRLRRPVKHVGYAVRGRLKVQETVAERIRGRPRLVSETTERVLDNPIVRTMVAAYQVLHRRLVNREVSDDEWIPARGRDLVPAMVRACGSRPELPSRREIHRIRYSPITETYRPFVALSEQIARMRGGTPDVSDEQDRVSGLLLDVAELWELFVVNTARVGLTGFRIVHGDQHPGPPWHVGQNAESKPLQSIVPDLLLKRNGQTRLIADAKYKLLSPRPNLGRPAGYERSDLYQLVTYLTAIPSERRPDGILVYPLSDEVPWVEAEGPWRIRTGQRVSFIQLPRTRKEARQYWTQLLSKLSGTTGAQGTRPRTL